MEKLEVLTISDKKSHISLSSIKEDQVSAILKELKINTTVGKFNQKIKFPKYKWKNKNKNENSSSLMTRKYLILNFFFKKKQKNNEFQYITLDLSKKLESEGLIKEGQYKLVDVHNSQDFMYNQIGTHKLKGRTDVVIVPYSIAGGFYEHCRVIIDWKTKKALKNYKKMQNQATGKHLYLILFLL